MHNLRTVGTRRFIFFRVSSLIEILFFLMYFLGLTEFREKKGTVQKYANTEGLTGSSFKYIAGDKSINELGEPIAKY